MKSLGWLLATGLFFSLDVNAKPGDGAVPLNDQDGQVIWQPKHKCETEVAFVYFDGRKPNSAVFLQRAQ